MSSEPVPGVETRMVGKTPQPTIDPQKIASDLAIANPQPVMPQPVMPQPVMPQPAPAQPLSAGGEPDRIDTPKPTSTEPKFFDEADPAPTQEEPKGDEEELEDVVNPGSVDFKKLRTAHRETKKTLAEIAKQKEELEAKVKQYETGEAFPDVVREQQAEIERLSKFEKVLNLKGSKEYKEKFVNPINDAKTKLKEIFADYGVPKEALDGVVNKALNAQGRPQLNQLLLETLGNDELGAAEAKAHILKAWDIKKQADAAEAEPAQALQTMEAESQAIQEVRETERRKAIVTVARNVWGEALNKIKEEGQLLELIHRDDDPEFNANFPDKIIPEAAKAYGKLVTELGNQGVKELPKSIAKDLAEMVLRAYASSVSAITRDRALNHIDTITTNLTRHHNMLRPQVGGGVARGGGAPAPKAIPTPEQEAQGILNSVLSRR